MPEFLNVPCSACYAVNRVSQTRLRDKPSCGRCKAGLFPDHPVALDDTTFARYVERASLPVVVDFWAAWCGPCKMMAPQFEAAARGSAGQALFAKVDTDRAQQVAAQYGIRSIPTLIAFREGREIARQSGAMSQAGIVHWLASLPN